jgi:hypothetical protein
MNRDRLKVIKQLEGFTYHSIEDNKFRTTYPVSIIKGKIGSAKTNSKLEELFSPFSVEEATTILQNAHRGHFLNLEVVDVRPCDKDLRFSKEFAGTVTSSYHKESKYQFPWVRNAFDPERVEFGCTCEKIVKERELKSIWEPIILEEWGLEKRNEKFYNWPTCHHICSLDSRLKDIADLKVLGIDDKLDYPKPYVLAYLRGLEIAPEFPDYVFNYAFTYHSSIFDGMKKEVDEMRSLRGLGKLTMYDDFKVKNYIESEFGLNPKKVDEVVKAVSY